MANWTDGQFSEIMDFIWEAAAEREANAGFAGESHDGGAKLLRTQVQFFRHGMNRWLPPEWEQFAAERQMRSDPEWQTYQRLKAKFGD